MCLVFKLKHTAINCHLLYKYSTMKMFLLSCGTERRPFSWPISFSWQSDPSLRWNRQITPCEFHLFQQTLLNYTWGFVFLIFFLLLYANSVCCSGSALLAGIINGPCNFRTKGLLRIQHVGLLFEKSQRHFCSLLCSLDVSHLKGTAHTDTLLPREAGLF